MTDDLHDNIDSTSGATARARPATAILALVCLGLVLYVPGLRWGLPATASWSQDTIAGVRTLGAVETWPGSWAGRYPPLHYLLLRAAYEPYLRWAVASGAASRHQVTGQLQLEPPFDKHVGALLLIARAIAAVMAIGATLAIFVTARKLLHDTLAAGVAAATLMASAAYAYFAHLGNVDIPSVFWFALSLVFYVRLLDTRRIADALLLGFFGSLAISTKDSVAGAYPGMAIVLLGVEIVRLRADRSWFLATIRVLFQSRWLVGLAAFAIPYLFLNGVFNDPQAYLDRMKYWLGITPGTIHLKQHHYDGQLALFAATIYYAAGAVGWPLLAVMVASTVHALRRHKQLALIVFLPVLTYYLIIIVPQGFVYSRFLFPPLALLGIPVGRATVDLLRNSRIPAPAPFAVLAVVAILTLGYTLAIDAEMVTDSRYAAERWFDENVARTQSVGAFSKPQYLPRLPEMGYATFGVEMTREAFSRPQPDYLVLSSYNHEDFDENQRACMHELIDGELGYDRLVTFRGRFLGAGSNWLSLAGWGAPTPGKISPVVTVLKRRIP